MSNRLFPVVTSVAVSVVAVGRAIACEPTPMCLPTSECMTLNPARSPVAPKIGSGGSTTAPQAASIYPSKNVTFMSQLTLAQIGGGAGSSLYGWVDPLTSREYAIMGRSTGTSVVDITDPVQPKYVANIPSAGSNTSWREPKVYGNTAYIGVDGGTHRLQMVDLTQVRNYAGTTLNLGYSTFSTAVNGAQITKVHTLQINKDSGYLYLSGTNIDGDPGTGTTSGAPVILDVRNPGTPLVAGTVPSPTSSGWDGYSHETQVVMYRGPDATYHGREIMISSNGKSGSTDTLSIIDVTNKTAPTRLASRGYTGAGYIHQGWFTEDQRYFFQNDETDEPSVGRTRTHLWDMTDLNSPVYKGFFQHQGISVDHNLYVKGDFVYMTNYTTGLRIMKIGDLTSTNSSDWLTEVGYFDTYLPNDGSSFNGAWNNYPYFPSGNIAISDINGGLFVVRPQLGKLGLSDTSPPIFDSTMGPIAYGIHVPEPTSAAVAVGLLAAGGLRRSRRGR